MRIGLSGAREFAQHQNHARDQGGILIEDGISVRKELVRLMRYAFASVGEVLVQTQPRKAPTQQARARRLARLQRLAPQILAIQLEAVEGVRCIPPPPE